MTDKTVQVAEIFGPTIQGEGVRAGLRTFFVRFGGCDYRCSWCDSLHAVLPEHRFTWNKMSASAVLTRLEELGAGDGAWVTLSGGNPALQDLRALILLGKQRGFNFAMETQGSVAKDYLLDLDHLTLSPKPPSSGNPTPFADLDAVLRCSPYSTELKVVVFDDADLDYALSVHERHPVLPFSVSVGNANVDPAEAIDATRTRLLTDYTRLVDRVLARGLSFRVLPQLHALLWGNKVGV